jgi:uncharacterized protein (TIGR00251 family)
MIRDTATGVEIDIRVIPCARKTEVSGQRDGKVLVRVAAPPVENAANEELIGFLAEALSVPRRSIRLVRGEHSRSKVVAVTGVSAQLVRECLHST